MTVVFAFCAADAEDALRLMRWIAELGNCRAHEAWLAADPAAEWALALSVLEEARKAFRSAEMQCPDAARSGWPEAANDMFLFAARQMEKRGEPFLWCEPDCVPTQPGWLDRLEQEYARLGKPFMGALVKGSRPDQPALSLGGCAVYPPDAASRLERFCLGPLAWDVASAAEVLPCAADTPLIQWFWGERDWPPTFVLRRHAHSPRNALEVSMIRPDAVLFHRNKDGSLIRLLRERMFPGTAPNSADVVSLRRAGDIIVLLPLLRHAAETHRRAIRLVVHREFVPLLDGVSYAEAVPWDGDWEDPLAAARQFRARNAQVFGRGLQPDMARGNFAKLAWKALGYGWNRYWPLVFDRRNHAREERLAASVFKTSRPKILVKLHGNSSPFPFREQVEERLAQEIPEAELVWLDKIRADRLYDLLGLMDRASALLTVDTVTLWLAHASSVPMIQLVNDTAFGASPPRGHCLLRVPYRHALSRWPEIVRLLKRSLNKDIAPGMVMAVAGDKHLNEETRQRQREVEPTWRLLGARVLRFSGKRSSADLGDSLGLPFVRDMVQEAMRGGEGVIVVSNNDVSVDPGLRDSILASCRAHGCWWAYRVDRPGGNPDGGIDLFAFTRSWWALHEHLMPDLLLGCRWWDNILRRIMVWSGCPEQPRLYYHRPHPGVRSRMHLPSSAHVERLAQQWLLEHDEQP